MHPMDQYPKRPRATDAMRLEAATVIEARLGSRYQGIATDLATIDGEWMDGYEICKELESNFYYDGDLMLAQELDCYGSEIRKLREDAEKAWADEHNIQPPYPIGTRIREGVITGVYSHGAAKYLVDYGKPGSQRIISFEDATPVEEPAAA